MIDVKQLPTKQNRWLLYYLFKSQASAEKNALCWSQISLSSVNMDFCYLVGTRCEGMTPHSWGYKSMPYHNHTRWRGQTWTAAIVKLGRHFVPLPLWSWFDAKCDWPTSIAVTYHHFCDVVEVKHGWQFSGDTWHHWMVGITAERLLINKLLVERWDITCTCHEVYWWDILVLHLFLYLYQP